MNTKNKTDWMQLIQECRSGGLSDREWCSQNGIPVSTFYYHFMRLREQACDIPAPISRKASVRQEVVRLDIIDELPGTFRNEQVSTRAHPGPHVLPESTAVRIHCGDAVLEVMNEAGTEVIRAALLAPERYAFRRNRALRLPSGSRIS